MMTRFWRLAALLLAASVGCAANESGEVGPGDEPDAGGSTTPDSSGGGLIPPGATFLTPEQHLVRVAMALRGVRPTPDELAAVTADPAAIEAIVEGYLETDEFGATMRDLHNEALLTRDLALPPVEDLAAYSSGRVMRSIGDEPLRLIEHVIMSDRPYTEIVTAPYTVADDLVAAAYGLPYDAAGPTWQEQSYTDGRPEAGVLTSTSMFLRHRSAGTNWHRGRANLISKALLCDDFLDRDVTIDTSIDLSDPTVVRDAVIANPACASCHQTLDPLASYFWGFEANRNINQIMTYPVGLYDPAREPRWRGTSGRPPSFFGLAGTTLADLGQLIADDPRFTLCAARRFYGYLAQMPLHEIPLDVVSRFQRRFEVLGFSAKELAKAIVLSDEFRVSYAADDATAETLVGVKKARPEQLTRLFEDLTGFRWLVDSNTMVQGAPLGRVDLLQNDVVGFRVLAGGIDSEFVVEPAHTTNATSSLVLRGLAAEAAGYVVTRDFAEADLTARKLLGGVSATERGEAPVRAQLVTLFARLYGEVLSADDPEIDATFALFETVLTRTDDPVHAWKTTLTAMLQDLRIASY